MHERELVVYEVCSYDPGEDQLQQICAAFAKVFDNLDALRDAEKA